MKQKEFTVKPSLECGKGNVVTCTVMENPTFHLQKTDITQPALEALAESQVRRVLIVGRRGPMQVACTIKVCASRDSLLLGRLTTATDV